MVIQLLTGATGRQAWKVFREPAGTGHVFNGRGQKSQASFSLCGTYVSMCSGDGGGRKGRDKDGIRRRGEGGLGGGKRGEERGTVGRELGENERLTSARENQFKYFQKKFNFWANLGFQIGLQNPHFSHFKASYGIQHFYKYSFVEK